LQKRKKKMSIVKGSVGVDQARDFIPYQPKKDERYVMCSPYGVDHHHSLNRFYCFENWGFDDGKYRAVNQILYNPYGNNSPNYNDHESSPQYSPGYDYSGYGRHGATEHVHRIEIDYSLYCPPDYPLDPLDQGFLFRCIVWNKHDPYPINGSHDGTHPVPAVVVSDLFDVHGPDKNIPISMYQRINTSDRDILFDHCAFVKCGDFHKFTAVIPCDITVMYSGKKSTVIGDHIYELGPTRNMIMSMIITGDSWIDITTPYGRARQCWTYYFTESEGKSETPIAHT